MQEQVNDGSNVAGRPFSKGSQTRTISAWFLFSGLGFALLVVIIAVASIAQLTYSPITYAAAKKPTTVTTTASATLIEDTSAKKITFTVSVPQTTLKNTNILAHVHAKSCTGTILFMLHGKTNGSGTANLGPQTFSKNVPKSIPATWFFNVHDAKAPKDSKGKPPSIGCSQFVSSGGSATASFTKTVKITT